MSKINTFVVPIIRPDFLGSMLESLYKYTEDNFYVFVIDQTPSGIDQSLYKDKIHLYIRPYRNLGFSKAMNTGIALSQTEYVTLANDDLAFMDKRWWQGIVDTFAMDENIIAVNPMSPKEGAWGYGLRDDNKETWKPPEHYAVHPEDENSIVPKKKDGTPFIITDSYDFLLNEHPGWTKDTVCDAIAMWCPVLKRTGIQEIGLLDEKFYPGGGEDYDMNCRAYSCAWPEYRTECDPKFHRRMVGTTKSWVWHHWGKSKDAMSGKDPGNALFASRERWNANDELWEPSFDVWGHHNQEDGTKTPLYRTREVFIDNL